MGSSPAAAASTGDVSATSKAFRFNGPLFSATCSTSTSPHNGQGRERVTAATWISTSFSQWGQKTELAAMIKKTQQPPAAHYIKWSITRLSQLGMPQKATAL